MCWRGCSSIVVRMTLQGRIFEGIVFCLWLPKKVIKPSSRFFSNTIRKTLGPSNVAPLISAVERGHASVVKELLSQNSSMLQYAKNNGKNALHFSARKGYADIMQALLDKRSQLARTDKKGQTALHMAVEGTNCDVVKSPVEADPAMVMLPDKFGSTALHVATWKKRVEVVNVLLLHPDTHAMTREHKTALDITKGLPLSEESTAFRECLCQYGAVRASELNQPRDELRKTVTEIKKKMMSTHN